MKKLLLAAIAMLLFACSSDDSAKDIAGSCIFDGDVILANQAEVNAFAAKNYCSVNGNIRLGTTIGFEKSDITNLDGLQSLTEVTGTMTISFTKNLVSLRGLNNLKAIGSFIKIVGNDNLKDLTGLRGLETIGTEKTGGIWFEQNNALTNLDGFENAKRIGKIIIRQHASLQDLGALKNVKSLESLEINRCPALVSLAGLEQMEYCGTVSLIELVNLKSLESLHNFKKTLRLYFNNCGLISLKGLEKIRLAISVDVYACSDITSLDGLNELNVISYLNLFGNENLISTAALSKVSTIVIDPTFNTGIYIESNNKLQSLNGLHNIVELQGSVFIQRNSALYDFCALTELARDRKFSTLLNFSENAIPMSVLKLQNGVCDY